MTQHHVQHQQRAPRPDRDKDPGVAIEYATCDTTLGLLLVATTARGVCFVHFGSADAELESRLAREFPYASRVPAHSARAKHWIERVSAAVDGGADPTALPLDVRGSRFQRRVWAALHKIPRGETRSYSDVARAIQNPSAVRAVAGACAANPVPIITPCHRVIAKSGALGGYAFGARRKRALLRAETAGA